MFEDLDSPGQFRGEFAFSPQCALQRSDGFVPGGVAGERPQRFDLFGGQLRRDLAPDLVPVLQSGGPIGRALLGIEQCRRRLGCGGCVPQVCMQAVDALLDRLTFGSGGAVSRLDRMEQMGQQPEAIRVGFGGAPDVVQKLVEQLTDLGETSMCRVGAARNDAAARELEGYPVARGADSLLVHDFQKARHQGIDGFVVGVAAAVASRVEGGDLAGTGGGRLHHTRVHRSTVGPAAGYIESVRSRRRHGREPGGRRGIRRLVRVEAGARRSGAGDRQI
ncbi:hypothetical protein [Nocardia cyriacigeorgica]|uniref:hypothetical protein n=1 Tax=Nocardia cyriacigeorgica TaxID=135487 RepID=UPI001E55F1C2|nr:hypothetical protein [Nocardia cyriacigeorgica]